MDVRVSSDWVDVWWDVVVPAGDMKNDILILSLIIKEASDSSGLGGASENRLVFPGMTSNVVSAIGAIMMEHSSSAGLAVVQS
eukprot:3350699-Rhodomonas_salina.1